MVDRGTRTARQLRARELLSVRIVGILVVARKRSPGDGVRLKKYDGEGKKKKSTCPPSFHGYIASSGDSGPFVINLTMLPLGIMAVTPPKRNEPFPHFWNLLTFSSMSSLNVGSGAAAADSESRGVLRVVVVV